MPSLPQLFPQDAPVILDGAWGTQLQARGLLPGECPDLWNVTRPGAVAAVATGYADAGSHIILTNTFGASRIALSRFGADSRVLEINREGVRLSKEAAGTRARVFASIGPTGKMLISGDVTKEDLTAAFDEQARALAGAGADGFVIETMTELAEATVAVEAARKTGLPVVACMTFDTGPKKDRTMMGLTPEQAAAGLEAAGADVIGANCGQGIEGYVAICRRLRSATGLPLWLKPNAGIPDLVNGRPVYHTTPDQFVRFVPQLISGGARFIGGCCGTSPEFIRKIRKTVSS